MLLPKINYINIEIIKPVPFEKSTKLGEAFQNFAGKANAYRSNILLRAQGRSILKNISPNNKDLVNLVEYSSKSGGDIKIKVLDIRKQISTSTSVKKVKISESDLENTNGKLFNLYVETFRKQ